MKRLSVRALSVLLSLALLFSALACGVFADAAEAPTTQELLQSLKITTAQTAEPRFCTPLGLRYVTAIDAAGYAALAADENVKEIRIGTLIAPAETVLRVGGITKALLEGALYVDVPATVGAWYAETGDTLCFAGSLVNIKEENCNLALMGVGYLTVELTNGETYTVYGAESVEATTMAVAAKIALRDKTLDESEQHFMRLFDEKFDGNMEPLYDLEMKGLNVLAIGDETMASSADTDSWVVLLAERYGWNLTDLAIDGATLSSGVDRAAPNASVYDLLMNDAAYAFGSNAYPSVGAPSGDPADVDLILLSCGGNDYSASVGASIGSGGFKNAKNYLDAMAMVTEKLLRLYPNATVVILSPWANEDQERADEIAFSRYFSRLDTFYKQSYEDYRRVCMIDARNPDVSGVDLRNDAFAQQYASGYNRLNGAGMALAAEHLLPRLWEVVAERNVPVSEEEQMQFDMDRLNVLAIGDSLFYGALNTTLDKVWVNSLGLSCGWNLTNLGIGGATITYDPNRTATNASMYGLLMNNEKYAFGESSYYNAGKPSGNPEDVDVILLQAGSNDCGPKVQAPVGTVDSDDPANFLGAWRCMTSALLQRYPNAIVIFITAWEQNDPARTEYTTSVVTLYNEVYAENDRVYLIDAGNPDVSGVDMRSSVFRSLYAYDPFHLNDEGMKLMAQSMLPLIWDVVKNQAKIR